MAKKKETTAAPEEEILVLHEKWVKAAKEHLREIIIVCLALVFLASLWALYNYYRQRKFDQAALLYAKALMVRDEQQKERLLEEVVRKYGNTSAGIEAELSLFENYLKKGNLEKAFEALSKVYKKSDPPLKFFAGLGEGYLFEEQHKLPQAEEKYEKAAKAKIGLEEIAYLDLARVAELQGQYERAVKYYRELIALKPSPEKLDFIQVKLDRLLEKVGKEAGS